MLIILTLFLIKKSEKCSKGKLIIPENTDQIEDEEYYLCTENTGALKIPESVKQIGNYAFYGCNKLSGLIIPDSVITIGHFAFSECSKLSGSLIIPNSVQKIGKYAFSNCFGFTGTLQIPDSVTLIDDHAFYNCYGFSKSLSISNSVKIISSYAFCGCFGFKESLNIGDSVTQIDSYAFCNCSGLSGTLYIPSSVIKISKYAFYCCSGFTGPLVFPEQIKSENEITNFLSKLLSYSFYKIEEFSFFGCSGFTSLKIPNSVTEIGEAAFSKCSGFKGSLKIPNSLRIIEKSVFSGCSKFEKSLKIPESVTEICEYAFFECSSIIGSLIIPNSVISIGKYSFYHCSGFNGALKLSDSLTTISEFSFDGCSGFIGSLIIPDTVSIIGECAFCGCKGFNGQLLIPQSIAKIGENSFKLTKFSKINFEGSNEPQCQNLIGFNKNDIVYVKDEYDKKSFCSYKISSENDYKTKFYLKKIFLKHFGSNLYIHGIIYAVLITIIIIETVVIHFQNKKLKEITSSNDSNEFENLNCKEFNILDCQQIDKLKSKGCKKICDYSEVFRVSQNPSFVLKEERNESKIRYFLQEYEILIKLDHPNIIKSYGICFGDESHPVSIILESCPSDLKNSLNNLKDYEQVSIIYEICKVMIFVHSNKIIHRDLKPENILLDQNNHVKLCDFGIAKIIESITQTMTSNMGTFKYMAPEIKNGSSKYDNKVDVYSFGIIVYNILTEGKFPNKDDKYPFKNSKINAFSQKLITKCLDDSPKNRPTFREIETLIKSNNFKLIDGVEKKIDIIESHLSELPF